MKHLFLLILFAPLLALGQQIVYKAPGTNVIAGDLVFSSGRTLTFQSGSTLTLPDNFIGWAKIDKAGSSLANLATRNFSDLQGKPTTLSGYGITDAQPLDADLTSIAGNTTGGFLTRTAANTYTPRTITGTAGQITVTSGDGVSGAPTISLPSTITQATTFNNMAGLIVGATANTGLMTISDTRTVAGGAQSILTLTVADQQWSVRNASGAFQVRDDQSSVYRFKLAPVSGDATFYSTTPATSTSTGALTVAGGIGVAGAGYFGSTIDQERADTTTSSNHWFRTGSNRIWGIGQRAGDSLFHIYDGVNSQSRITVSASNASGIVAFNGTLPATSTTAASATFGGGIGVAGAGYFGGNVIVARTTSDAVVDVITNSGQNRQLRFLTGSGRRWALGVTNVAETGSNAGSDFTLNAYDDTNGFIDSPITINRVSGGGMTLSRPVLFSSSLFLADGNTIGVNTGNRILFSATSSRFELSAGGNTYYLSNSAFYPVNDAARDLGLPSTARWRDLHISRTLNIGGGAVDATYSANIWGTNLLLGGDASGGPSRTDATLKRGRWSVPNYLNAQPPVMAMWVEPGASANPIYYGGGSSVATTATSHAFYTAPNATTLTGAVAMALSNSNLVLNHTGEATSTTSGAFQVAGGGSFQKNLYVGGNTVTTGSIVAKGIDLTQTYQSLEVKDYMLSDGATSGRRCEMTPGAAGDMKGQTTTLCGFIQWPTSNPGADTLIAWLGSGSLSNLAWNLYVRIFTNGSLDIVQFGATGGDYRVFSWGAARSTYSGQTTPFSVTVFGDSTTNPVVFINGVNVSANFATTSNGSVPNWMPPTLDCTKFVTGYNWPAGPAPIVEYGPGQWSAAESLAFAQTGRKPDWWAAGTGSAIEKIQNGDMSSATGWTLGGGWSIAGGKLVHSGVSSFGAASQSSKVVAGRKYRAKFTIEAISGNVLLFQNGNNTTVANIPTAGAQAIDFVATDTGDVKFKNPSNVTPLECTIDDFSLIDLGPVARHALQPGSTHAPDIGSNNLPMTFTGMSVISSDRFPTLTYDTSNNITTTSVFKSTNTTEATTGGAGSLTTAGGIYAAKKLVAISGVTVGASGSNLDFQRSSVTPLDFPNITSGSYQDLTYTVTGASPGDEVVITPDAPGFYYPLIVSARVSSANNVTITAFNPTSGDIDPASAGFRITVRSY